MKKGIDLSLLGIDELRELVSEAEKLIAQRLVEKRNRARRAAELAALKHGFTLEELGLGRSLETPGEQKTLPRYANPADRTQTWSGRGRQPHWFKLAMEQGRSPDDLKA